MAVTLSSSTKQPAKPRISRWRFRRRLPASSGRAKSTLRKAWPVAAATGTRPTAAGRLWRGRQRLHVDRGQRGRRLREFINLKIDILNTGKQQNPARRD